MTTRGQKFAAPAWLAPLALVLVIAGVFAQAARFPLTCWDDHHHVDAALSWLTRPLGYPMPLTVASYALLGRSAAAVHAWNVALHGAAAAGVLLLARTLGRGAWPAFVFALHPMVVEPVAWATGRKDLLATTLVVAAVALHARKVRPLVTTALYVLALAAKPSALPLPAILFAYDRLLAPERRSAWLLGLVPIGAADLWLAAAGDRALGGIREAALPLWERVPLAAGYEAAHLFAPVGLLPRYMPLTSPLPLGPALAGGLAIAVLAAAPIALRRRAPQAAFALAFAALAYLPAADLLHRTRFIADSYLYLPLAGLCLLVGSPRVPRWAPPILCALYLPLAFLQVRTWRSNQALFQPVVEAYPDSPTAWKQLGDSLVCDGQPAAAAIPVYLELERRFPASTIACGNLGLAYAQLGRFREAAASFARGAAAGDAKAAANLAACAPCREPR